MTVGTARDLWMATYGGGTSAVTPLMASCAGYCLSQRRRPRASPPLGWSTASTPRHRRSSATVRSGHASDSLGGENLLDPRANCNRGREASRRYGQYRRLADLVVC